MHTSRQHASPGCIPRGSCCHCIIDWTLDCLVACTIGFDIGYVTGCNESLELSMCCTIERLSERSFVSLRCVLHQCTADAIGVLRTVPTRSQDTRFTIYTATECPPIPQKMVSQHFGTSFCWPFGRPFGNRNTEHFEDHGTSYTTLEVFAAVLWRALLGYSALQVVVGAGIYAASCIACLLEVFLLGLPFLLLASTRALAHWAHLPRKHRFAVLHAPLETHTSADERNSCDHLTRVQ